jgi:hypothetical protein
MNTDNNRDLDDLGGQPSTTEAGGEPFDPQKAIAELVRDQLDTRGRKLSFFDQCAAFYALYRGITPRVVSDVFGISPVAVSQLGGCLVQDPRPYEVKLVEDKSTGEWIKERGRLRDMNRNRSPNRKRRYVRVADEFLLLGEEAFAHKYYPEHIHLRVTKVKLGFEDEVRTRRRNAPDLNADKDAGEWFIPATANAPADSFTVEVVDDKGWTFTQGARVAPERWLDSTKAMHAGYFRNYGDRSYKPQRPPPDWRK